MSTEHSPEKPTDWVAVLSDRYVHVERAKNSLKLARDAQKAAVLGALAAGWTEVDVARAAGVDRMTVRSWRGKST